MPQYIINVSDEKDAKFRRRFPVPEELFLRDVDDAVAAVDREDAEKAVQEQLAKALEAKPEEKEEDRTIVGQPETPIPVDEIIEPEKVEEAPETPPEDAAMTEPTEV